MIVVDLARAGAAAGRFHAAAAELPLSAGAVAVIDGGAGWTGRLDELAALDATSAVVVAEPTVVAPGNLEQRDGRPFRCAVERTRVRPLPDVAQAAAAGARGTVVEASLPADDAEAWLRDAIGWGRVLSGPLELASSTRTTTSLLALLATPSGIPVTLLASVTSGHPSIVARTLGETRVEVRVLGEGTTVRIASAVGELLLPHERETPVRAALRRALTPGCADLADLLCDERIRAALPERT